MVFVGGAIKEALLFLKKWLPTSQRGKGDRGIDGSDDNDKDDDDDNNDDDDDVHVHVHVHVHHDDDDDDDDGDDDDVEIKDNQGIFSVCEREGKPHGDVSLTRGKGKDGSFLGCPQMTFLGPAEEARERGA